LASNHQFKETIDIDEEILEEQSTQQRRRGLEITVEDNAYNIEYSIERDAIEEL
jgi:hypothetical protein